MNAPKLAHNAQTIRAEAFHLANTNAPGGTPTLLIMAEAEVIRQYIEHGVQYGSQIGETLDRVIAVKQLRQQQSLANEELAAKKAQVMLDAEVAAFNEEHPDIEEPGEVLAPEGAVNLTDVFETVDTDELRRQAVEQGFADGEVVEAELQTYVEHDGITQERFTEATGPIRGASYAEPIVDEAETIYAEIKAEEEPNPAAYEGPIADNKEIPPTADELASRGVDSEPFEGSRAQAEGAVPSAPRPGIDDQATPPSTDTPTQATSPAERGEA